MADEYGARIAVYEQFKRWNLKYDPSTQVDDFFHYNDNANHLCWLLKRTVQFNEVPLSPKELNICQALAGPNGFAIYKMLLARRCSDG